MVGIFYVEEKCPQNKQPYPLAQAISDAWKSQNKLQEINGNYYRFLEFAQKRSYFLVSFRAFKYDGPGHSKLESEDEIYTDMEPDDYFTHQTTLLFDHEYKFILLESAGMTAGAIGNYFTRFAEEDTFTSYKILPRIDDSAEQRYRGYRKFRTIEFRAAADPVGSLDHNSGLGMITAFSKELGAEFIDVKVTVGRKRSRVLSFEKVRKLVDGMIPSIAENHDISKLIVSGRGDNDKKSVPIDLIQHQEKRSKPLPVDITTRQILISERWRALERIRREFIAEAGL